MSEEKEVIATPETVTMSVSFIGSKTRDVKFQTGQTLEEIFSAVQIPIDNDTSVQVNGHTVEINFVPEPGAIVVITKNAGNG